MKVFLKTLKCYTNKNYYEQNATNIYVPGITAVLLLSQPTWSLPPLNLHLTYCLLMTYGS